MVVMEAYKFNTYEEAKAKIDEINAIEMPEPIQSRNLKGRWVNFFTRYMIDSEPIKFEGKYYIPKNKITKKYLQNNITINTEQDV